MILQSAKVSRPQEQKRHWLALAGMATALAFSSPATAGQAEMSLLASYVGDWEGSGLLEGAEEPEDFTCRMSITSAGLSKIFYAGRCSLVGMNLTVRGAIAYFDEARRYEASMTSNTAFSGIAIGRIQGDTIRFDLQETNPDDQGGEVAIGAEILLRQGIVTVDFDVTFGDSGDTMHASVPFAVMAEAD